MRLIFSILLVICVIGACRERYGLPIEKGLFNSLVVEGNILQGDTTVIRLSRTAAVADRNLLAETGATIRIEGNDNNIFPLLETDPGVYKVATLALNASAQYRLKISTDGKDYESDWTSLINTANIDSLVWERNNGVEIFVKSSGNADDSRYYKWDYDEVWDFYSDYVSKAYYTYVVGDAGKRNYQCLDSVIDGVNYNRCVEWVDPEGYKKGIAALYDDTLYHCWKYQNSTRVNIGSTAALSDNEILASVRKIDDNGFELTGLYSILVKQTGLSKEAYEFYKILKGNSEGMGSIFDAQPSQLKTNILCITDPTEIVIGFINATSVKSKRLYINRTEVRDWHYFDTTSCVLDTVVVGVVSKFVGSGTSAEQVSNALTIGQVPLNVIRFEEGPAHLITMYSSISKGCVDCRVRGVHKKPDFWPQ